MQMKKVRGEGARWYRNQGHMPTLAINILIWIGSYLIVVLVHSLFFRWGWVRTPGSISGEDCFIAAITGCTVGQLEWSVRKRKLLLRDGKIDGTMI
jgi:hypothetical protein